MRPATFDFAGHFADTRFYFEIDGMPETAREIVGWRALVREYAERFTHGSTIIAGSFLGRTSRWDWGSDGTPIQSVLGTADMPTGVILPGMVRTCLIYELNSKRMAAHMQPDALPLGEARPARTERMGDLVDRFAVDGNPPLAAFARAKAEVEETRCLYASGIATSEALEASVKRFVESADAAFSSLPPASCASALDQPIGDLAKARRARPTREPDELFARDLYDPVPRPISPHEAGIIYAGMSRSSPPAPPPAGETRSATSTEYADREPIGWPTSITMPPEAWILAAFVVSIVTFLAGFGLGLAL